jgi:signal transduction histidine kinase
MLGLLGVLQKATQPRLGADEVALLTSLADRVGAVVESNQLRRRAERAAVLEERQRLARDMHDSVTQTLYSATLLTETGRQAAGVGDVEIAGSCLDRLSGVTQQALKEMRLLIYELRPPVLEQEGLVGALQQRLDAVESRAGIDARLLTDGELGLDPSCEEALYRIALEALNNALKHAVADSVVVRIHASDAEIELRVSDDGQGFDPSHAGSGTPGTRSAGGMGLVTMRERVERIGGTLAVTSAPGGGTTVEARIGRNR